jgi:predicted kinase
MSGISGAGKTAYAKHETQGATLILSVDDYFEKSGVFKYDPNKLHTAYSDCFRRFLDAAQTTEQDTIIIDNTNTTAIEIAPYFEGALAYGWIPELVTLHCRTTDDVKICAARNKHGVPYERCLAQNEKLRNRVIPVWWRSTNIDVKTRSRFR